MLVSRYLFILHIDDLENIKEELIVETARVKELDAGKRKIEIEYDAISAILEVSNKCNF